MRRAHLYLVLLEAGAAHPAYPRLGQILCTPGARGQAGHLEGDWPGAPDLAIEVISPGDNDTDVEDQGFDWLEAGTRLVMVINPRRHVVTVYRSLAAITLLLETDVLDGGEWYPIGQSLSETYVNNGESTRRAS